MDVDWRRVEQPVGGAARDESELFPRARAVRRKPQARAAPEPEPEPDLDLELTLAVLGPGLPTDARLGCIRAPPAPATATRSPDRTAAGWRRWRLRWSGWFRWRLDPGRSVASPRRRERS